MPAQQKHALHKFWCEVVDVETLRKVRDFLDKECDRPNSKVGPKPRLLEMLAITVTEIDKREMGLK